MRRPGAWLALWYAAGVWLADVVEPPLTGLWLAALGLWGACWLWREGRNWSLPALVAVMGGLNLCQRSVPLAPHDLRWVVAERVPVLTTLRGRLGDTPTLRLRLEDGQESVRTVALVEVEAVQLRGEWQAARGRVLALTPGDLGAGFHGGQGVEVEGVLDFPPEAVAPGLLDYRAYLARRGVYYRLMVASPADWKLWGEPVPVPWTDRFVAWATRQLQRGQTDDPAVRLLRAMTLGWRTALTEEVSEPFLRSGTMHVFAISGLHIALLSGILLTALRVSRLPRWLCAGLVIPLLWFYTAATGWQPSAIRATIMMTVVVAGWWLARPGDLPNSLGLAAWIILLWEPEQLFHAGFQLSFAVVASLAVWLPRVESWTRAWLQADPYVPPEARSRGFRWLEPCVRGLALAVGTSWAAWVGSLPLIAWHFHILTPVTLVANLAVVPCASLALASCVGSWLCGAWAGWIGELFNHSAWLWMQLMLQVSQWAAQVPWGSWFVSRPTGLEVAGYYGLTLWALAGGWKRVGSRIGWVVVALCWLGTVAWGRWQQWQEWRLTMLPAGRAAVLWTQGPGRQGSWLINCGRPEDVEFVVEPFLRGQGVDQVPELLLAQGLADSMSGALELVESRAVRRVWVSAAGSSSAVYRKVLTRLEQEPGRLERLSRGHQLGPWRVLHPEGTDRFARAADGTVVLLGEMYGVRVLWLGGLGRQGQELLMAREPDLRADLLVLGGPGLAAAVLPTLLERVQPRGVVVLDGTPARPAREMEGVRAALSRAAIPIWYTSQVGAVECAVDNRGLRLRSMRGAQWHLFPEREP